MKKVVAILLIVILLGVVIYFSGRGVISLRQGTEPTPIVLDTAVAPQEVAITVNGQVVPERWVELAFGRSGKVEDVAIRVGDMVQQGDVLARLEAEDLSLDLLEAQQDLALQEARLAQTKAKAVPQPEEIAAAEAELASARASLEELRSLPDPVEIEEARIRLEITKDDLWAAQASRDAVARNPGVRGGAELDQANARVAAAEMNVRLAELAYKRAQEGPDPAQIKASEARLAQAEAALAALRRGISKEEIRVLEIQVEQAKARLEKLRKTQQEMQEASEIVAPFAGTIVSVEVRPGEFVSGQKPVITLADTSEFKIETTDLDEWDLKRVRIGELLDVKVPGLDNRILPARVVSIAPRATTLPTGDVGYTVTLALEKQDPGLRWGMSVRIEFPAPKISE